jgi:hypothetical protein
MGYYENISIAYNANDPAFDYGGDHIKNFCNTFSKYKIANVYVEVKLPFSTAKLNCYVGKVISININTNRIEVQFDYEDLIWNHDIVLTTYESLRKYANTYKKIMFHRYYHY